jgi:hypothetical protein
LVTASSAVALHYGDKPIKEQHQPNQICCYQHCKSLQCARHEESDELWSRYFESSHNVVCLTTLIKMLTLNGKKNTWKDKKNLYLDYQGQ